LATIVYKSIMQKYFEKSIWMTSLLELAMMLKSYLFALLVFFSFLLPFVGAFSTGPVLCYYLVIIICRAAYPR
jgi:hypothetical protein